MRSEFTKRLLKWYAKQGRELPWRGSADPYAVWVSEIMAQQTRLEAVIPYYERWMKRFPTIKALASARQRDVLNAWEGLGYYSRARNLHQAAQIVVQERGGKLPTDVEKLRKLPGIGRYTAGAIASLAFGLDEAVVDGNIKRVLARVFNVEEAVDGSAGEKRIWALAEEHLPHGKAGNFNQALMDLGAGICLPRQPRCEACPVEGLCKARALGVETERPVRKPKADIPHHTVTAAVIRKNGRVLIAQRPAKGLLGGLWEFPGGKRENGESLKACLRREISEEMGVKVKVGKEIGEFEHAYSHFRVTLHAFTCSLEYGKPRPLEARAIRWARLSELNEYPMGKLDRQIAKRLAETE